MLATVVSWMPTWLQDALGYLGLLPKNAKILFLGLDNAGKSTLLMMMKEDRLAVIAPTVYPNHEELWVGNIKFSAYDLGGHETARRIWRDYYANVDGILFLVDAADRTRFVEVREELQRLLEEPCLSQVPFAVLGNKVDIPVAASEDEMRYALGLEHHRTTDRLMTKHDAYDFGRPVEIFMCSVARRMGYAEAFQWLGRMLN
mmetsp:Transcript_537/g.1480  ORF Transcript_537/g.1480 Transcript_537/m.1480 type:complete len:202 (-) Transcript_537:42-647(-)